MDKIKLIPFDIEKAKQGAKIVTRCGYPVRIGFFDIKCDHSYKVAGAVEIDGKETIHRFTTEGKYSTQFRESDLDLLIEEEIEETDDYDPYKATVESMADMVEKYSELQTLEELKDFYNNVKIKCREAVEYEKKWCKNQDEKKPADNKPKFKVGDWIVQENVGVYKVTEIWDSWYEVIDSHDELHYSIGFDQESMCHLWSINDAKDGDVLHSIGLHNDCIFIFDRLDNWKFEADGDRAVATGYCCISIAADKMEFGIQGPDCIEVNTVKPATKKQRDLLFQKMKEAGYEWNSDKKELHKIEAKFKVGDKVVLKRDKSLVGSITLVSFIGTYCIHFKDFNAGWYSEQELEPYEMIEKEVKIRRMTHQELAWWLRDKPEEHREYMLEGGCRVYSADYDYLIDEADEEVGKIFIRKNGGEWHKPLIEEQNQNSLNSHNNEEI